MTMKSKRKNTTFRIGKDMTISISNNDTDFVNITVYGKCAISRIEVNGYKFYPSSKFSNGSSFIVRNDITKDVIFNVIDIYNKNVLIDSGYFLI